MFLAGNHLTAPLLQSELTQSLGRIQVSGSGLLRKLPHDGSISEFHTVGAPDHIWFNMPRPIYLLKKKCWDKKEQRLTDQFQPFPLLSAMGFFTIFRIVMLGRLLSRKAS